MADLRPSHNSIIPTDLQNELLVIREATTLACFRIGDIAAELVAKFATGPNPQYQAGEIESAIGYFVGKKARTVRYYRSISEKIPGDMREEFALYDLSWAHFALAARFPGREVEVLSWAVQNVAGVDRVEAHFVKGEQDDAAETPPTRFEFHTLPQLLTSVQMFCFRIVTHPDQQARVRALLKELGEIIGKK